MFILMAFYISGGCDYIVLKGDDVGRGTGTGYFMDIGVNPAVDIYAGIGYRGLSADYRDTTFTMNGAYLFYRYDFHPLSFITLSGRLEGGIFKWGLEHNGERVQIITFTPPNQIDTTDVEGYCPGVGGNLGLIYRMGRFFFGVSGGAMYLTDADRDKFGKEDDNEWFYNGRVYIGIGF